MQQYADIYSLHVTLHVSGVMHPSSGVLKTVSATSGVRHGNGTVTSFLRGLIRTIAAIWYNKTCRHKHLTPTYVNIRIKGKNPQNQKTLRTANQYRIKQEIKFLYIKKTKLNEQSPDQATEEGSNGTITMTYTRGSRYSF